MHPAWIPSQTETQRAMPVMTGGQDSADLAEGRVPSPSAQRQPTEWL